MDLEKVILGLFNFTKKYLITLFATLFTPWRLYQDVEYRRTKQYLDYKVFFFISYLSLIWEYYSFIVSLKIADSTSILNAINEEVEEATYFQKLVYFIPLFIITYLVLGLIVTAVKSPQRKKTDFESLLYYFLGAYLVWYLILYFGGLEISERVFHSTVDYRSSNFRNFSNVDFVAKMFNYFVITGLSIYILMISIIIIRRNHRNKVVLLKLMVIPFCLICALYVIQEIIEVERSTFKIDENEVLVKGANGGSSSHGLLDCRHDDPNVEITLSLALINKKSTAVYLDSRSSLTMRILPDSFFKAYISNTDLFDTVKFDRNSEPVKIFGIDPSLFKDSGILVIRPGDIRFVKFSIVLDTAESKRIFAFKGYDPMFIFLPVDIPLNTERKFNIDHARGIIPVFTCQ